ncbi:hypothetical protein HAX54_031875 [Datura stramonium]|uniref:Uncharacterized protein n=1 Tax=Datura stramonium TaxID=4076 RepID=A0ABS8VDE1_DATST|nr:hypothetical protein [Datura stramonium]
MTSSHTPDVLEGIALFSSRGGSSSGNNYAGGSGGGSSSNNCTGGGGGSSSNNYTGGGRGGASKMQHNGESSQIAHDVLAGLPQSTREQYNKVLQMLDSEIEDNHSVMATENTNQFDLPSPSRVSQRICKKPEIPPPEPTADMIVPKSWNFQNYFRARVASSRQTVYDAAPNWTPTAETPIREWVQGILNISISQGGCGNPSLEPRKESQEPRGGASYYVSCSQVGKEPSIVVEGQAIALGASSPKRQIIVQTLPTNKSKELSTSVIKEEGAIQVSMNSNEEKIGDEPPQLLRKKLASHPQVLGEVDRLFREAGVVEVINSTFPMSYDPVVIGASILKSRAKISSMVPLKTSIFFRVSNPENRKSISINVYKENMLSQLVTVANYLYPLVTVKDREKMDKWVLQEQKQLAAEHEEIRQKMA